jgi:hypothetical protein
MSAGLRRFEVLRVIAAGALARTSLQGFADVDQELQELAGVRRVTPERRRHLLEVVHGMRALETALKEVVRSHGFRPESSIGRLLYQLSRFPISNPSHLNQRSFSRFMNTVRTDRNRFMHDANAFPRTAREADRILGEVAACFVMIVK